jgi:hypothetical protein
MEIVNLVRAPIVKVKLSGNLNRQEFYVNGEWQSEGLNALRDILPYLDKGFRYAVEVRHRSWFQDLAYNFFRNNQMCLVWSQLAETLPLILSDVIGKKQPHTHKQSEP